MADNSQEKRQPICRCPNILDRNGQTKEGCLWQSITINKRLIVKWGISGVNIGRILANIRELNEYFNGNTKITLWEKEIRKYIVNSKFTINGIIYLSPRKQIKTAFNKF